MFTMRRFLTPLTLASIATTGAFADDPALTIYNDRFGVVRESIRLDLNAGMNDVRFADATAHVEADSVILRDPAGQRKLQIFEQNYRNDPATQARLLALFEGKEIDFVIPAAGAQGERVVTGKVIRSGYQPHFGSWDVYGPEYAARQSAMISAGGGGDQPIIEIEGRVRFGLPGIPLFPTLGDESILKPAFEWKIQAEESGPLNAELAYVTSGMRWQADYNVVAPETGQELDLIGWITMDNQTGKTFRDAKIKLMAGDVQKIREQPPMPYARARMAMADAAPTGAPVTEKSFDEYHLYSLSRPTTLRDSQTKQVEFLRGTGVPSQVLYVYEGAAMDNYAYWDEMARRDNPEYGTQSNKKVWVMREFRNDEKSGLGVALPKGRMRFYRRDSDGRLEFTGENIIDHTPKDEIVRVYTGNAFDIVGERKRTDFEVNSNERWARESFEITLRNHKTVAAEVRVVERLYRWTGWEITKKSQDFTKLEAQKVEFRVSVPADGEKTVTYSVRYRW